MCFRFDIETRHPHSIDRRDNKDPKKKLNHRDYDELSSDLHRGLAAKGLGLGAHRVRYIPYAK
jgi:hypothetical protein